MILVSIMGFSGTPDIVVCPEKFVDIAWWVKSMKETICSRSNNKFIFQNRSKFVILMFTIEFSGTPDMVV